MACPPLLQRWTSSRPEIVHLWPQFLPDGKHFLFFAFGSGTQTGAGNSGIYASSLDSKERKLILSSNADAVYVLPGYLLFTRQGTLMAQPFDTARLELAGEAVPIAQGIQVGALVARGLFLLPTPVFWLTALEEQRLP